MPIIEIDDLGRMTIPKEIGARNTKAIIIPAGSFSSHTFNKEYRKHCFMLVTD